MSWRNIKLVLFKEVRDQLRDRRTLFMIAVLPILLYPALGIGMVQMTVLFSEQPRTVVLLGRKNLPDISPIEGNRFVAKYFSSAADAGKLVVVTDDDSEDEEPTLPLKSETEREELLQQGRRIREKIEARGKISDPDALAQHDAELAQLFGESRMQLLIIIPDGFRENIERINRELAKGSREMAKSPDYSRPIIVRTSADEKSQIAYHRVNEAVKNWETVLLKERLKQAQLPENFSTPVQPDTVDVAQSGQISASLWSKLLPALLVIMAVTGAFYPAVDLAAGEKERGTMETLLISPASRSEIVIGKFLTVMMFSVSTAILNLFSMGLTGRYMVSIAQGGSLSRIGNLTPPSFTALLWVLALMLPLAALFSALCLALATFARSSKEGQYYLTPILMVTLGLTVFCMSPAVEITPFYSTMPIVGPTLLLKELLVTTRASNALIYSAPVALSSIGYSLLALWWAIDQFSREEVLFREAERFELRLWISKLLRDKQPTPSFAEAGLCFVLMMILQFAALKFFSEAWGHHGEQDKHLVMIRLLMTQQLVIIATPALLMGVMLTSSVRRTFRLYWPGWKMLGAALLLAVAVRPLTVELMYRLQWYFPPPSESLQKLAEVMTDSSMPVGLLLLAFALVPALCEEVAFRGFLLSGFSEKGRYWLAIVLSSITFGVIHMMPQQIFNASLLGLVIGLIAVRSNSLLAGIVFHAAYNGMQVATSQIRSLDWVGSAPARWFFYVQTPQGTKLEILRFGWPTLLISAVIAIVLLRWLVNYRREDGLANDHKQAELKSQTTPSPSHERAVSR